MGREVQVGNKTVTLKIVRSRPARTVLDLRLTARQADTAGGEKFRTLTSSFFRHADAVIIAYDVTNRESFTNVAAAHKVSASALCSFCFAHRPHPSSGS